MPLQNISSQVPLIIVNGIPNKNIDYEYFGKLSIIISISPIIININSMIYNTFFFCSNLFFSKNKFRNSFLPNNRKRLIIYHII